MFKRKPIRAYIGGMVYDTSLAKEVLKYKEFSMVYGCYKKYALYKGKKRWFLECGGKITPIFDGDTKEILIKHNLNKFIEYFGEVEYA